MIRLNSYHPIVIWNNLNGDKMESTYKHTVVKVPEVTEEALSKWKIEGKEDPQKLIYLARF